MTRVESMARRLPNLYRDGELLRGSRAGRTGGVLDPPAVQLEILDEDAVEVQVSHWFGTARTLDEAGRLAAVLDLVPEPWHTLPIFRSWVEALRDAMLDEGAVTVQGLQRFVEIYAAGFQTATRVAPVPRIVWNAPPSVEPPALVEFPRRRRELRVPAAGGIEPLHQFPVVQKGLDEATASFLVTGLASGPEFVPTLVNVTTGQALVFLGAVAPGQRLWLSARPDGNTTARLEGSDVTDRLVSVSGVLPGTPWGPGQVERPARAMALRRGANDLWFLPLAHHDAPGLDRVLLALGDLRLDQGRWDESTFDHALFVQDPAAFLDVAWIETVPATLEVRLPGGLLLSRAGHLDDGLAARATLEQSLGRGVATLRAVGVDATVVLRPFADRQPHGDVLARVLPLVVREGGPTGADRMPDAGGVFDVTTYEESTYR
jgi:hypothetical protein